MTTAEMIRLIVGGKKFEAITCSVLQVNQSERTCDCRPLNGDADVFGVRLQTDINATVGLYQEPEVNSNVIIGFLNKSAAYLILCSAVAKFEIVIGNTSFKMDGSTIEMNGGSLGGMVKVNPALAKLNAIETNINLLKSLLVPWVPVSVDGIALKIIFTAWCASVLTPTTLIDLEDTKVKH
jgi:hypothetical protein